MKKILLIEDEPGVHEIFKTIFSDDIVIIQEMDTYDINTLFSVDYIFIDRDNPYSPDKNYHTYFLDIVNGYLSKDLIDKIYYISGTELNNKALISKITSLCIYDNDGNYIITNRDEQSLFEQLMYSHILTKSYPDFKDKLKKIAH